MEILSNTRRKTHLRTSEELLIFGVVSLMYIALTLFAFRNFIVVRNGATLQRFHLGSTLIGPPEDNLQDFWNTWYAASRVETLRDLGYTNLIKYPEGTTLHYHSFAYPMIAIARVFAAIWGTRLARLVALQNLLLIMSFPLSAIGGFYLVRHFTQENIGAMVGGAVFAFNPSHIAHVTHHIGISSIEFMPFFVLTFILAVERKSWAFVLLSTLFLALNALSTWYYLIYCLYFMVFFCVLVAIKQKRVFDTWPLRVLLCNVMGVLALLSPLLVPMIVQAAKSAHIQEGGIDNMVADVVGYFSFPPTHLLSSLSRNVYSHLAGNPWESTVYLGWVNIALLGWLIVRRKHLNRDLISFVLSGMAVFALLASGDYLHVFGHSLRIPLPDLLLTHLPFLEDVSTPSRAIVVVYMFLSIGVGYAISTLREGGRSAGGRIAIAGIVLLMALDWYPRPLPGTRVACLPPYSLLAQDSDSSAGVLDLPRGLFENRGYVEGNIYMMNQVCHLHPIVDGTISHILNKSLEDQLETYDLDKQRQQLAEDKVKYIIIHRPTDGLFQWSAEDGQVDQYEKKYPVLYRGYDAIVLGVY